ncbi:ribose 1,5-bisphosphokinase [Enterobacter asburiae]|uniref:Ribose 1,5-bisphosphokinase n=1 Tax=Enterobacter asburiae TaxID=61645 RepID=A0A376FJ40_ENTAS|nr:ribose 1,5-bisphosphokinase [Enterobacter asburiae]
MGRLIWLMGPSGSGKDSLLSALRQQEHARLFGRAQVHNPRGQRRK